MERCQGIEYPTEVNVWYGLKGVGLIASERYVLNSALLIEQCYARLSRDKDVNRLRLGFCGIVGSNGLFALCMNSTFIEFVKNQAGFC